MTSQDFAQKIKNKYPQYKDMDDYELSARIIAKYPQYAASVEGFATTSDTASEDDGNNPVKDIAGGATFGFSAPGRTVQNLLSRGVDKLFGTKNFGQATKEGFEKSTGVDVDSTAGKIGKFVGEAATFAIPGGAVSKATKGASMATRMLAEGGTAGAVEIAQTGDIDTDTAITAVFGGAMPPAGKALSAAGSHLTKSLPEWLVSPLLKQAKDAKIKGQDIAPFLLKTGRVGSVDTILSKTDEAITALDNQVNASLRQATQKGVSVPLNNVFSKVIDDINAAGGAIDEVEIKSIVDRLAPQARGLLNKPVLTLEEANQLRSSIDRTLGDRGFLRDQLPFNKEILRDFTNNLRETVKSLGPDDLRATFDDYSKNIRLRNALLERASSGGGANSVGLFDILSGMGGFAASGGNPLGAIALPAARRVFESAAVKTGAAKALTSMQKLGPVLEKLTPVEQGVLLETLQSLLEDDQPTK